MRFLEAVSCEQEVLDGSQFVASPATSQDTARDQVYSYALSQSMKFASTNVDAEMCCARKHAPSSAR